MKFIGKIAEELIDRREVLREELSDEPPKKISRIIATLAGKDDFLFTFYSEHVLWEPKPGLGTCGVRPYGDGNHIVFAYDPEFFLSIPIESVYFLLAHELYHILRDHHARGAEHAKLRGSYKHDMMNIAMDVWINTDLKTEGSLGGFAMEPPFEGYAFQVGGKWGDVEKWVNDIIEKSTGTRPDPEEKYSGIKLAEPLYDWILEMFEKYNLDAGKEDDGEPQENYPKPGMIIRGPNGQYGQVIEVDDDTKKVTKIEPLEKEEAIRRVKEG